MVKLFRKIKVWDLEAALDPRVPPNNICIKTLSVGDNVVIC